MKRILLFVLTNFAVMAVLLITTRILGVDRFLTANGLDMTALAVFSLVIGFGGAFISLLMSKPMAKWSTGAQVINDSQDPTHMWIVQTVARFADKAGIKMPEVAIYEGEPNAFATGAFKNSALVAVSTGLLGSMQRQEVEAVILKLDWDKDRLRALATAVGAAGINIDDMDVGTNASGEAALMVLALDRAVPADVVDGILATPGVLDAKAIDLD